jgi:hypothetical protein
MKILFEIELSSEDTALLTTILNCKANELNGKLNTIGSASFEEHIKMILGQKVFTRGRDMLDYRLFVIIKHLFAGKIPDEQEISGLFQTTITESRSMIKSITSKYQYELKLMIEQTLAKEVEGIQPYDDGYKYKITKNNQFIINELNRVLGALDPMSDLIEKDPKKVSLHLLTEASYLKLCTKYGVTRKPLKSK